MFSFPDLKEKLKSKFVKNVFTLFTGSVIGQVILFAFIPLLTRLYPEELFGILFIFSSLTAILKAIATLKFELSIVLPDKDKHAVNLLVVALFINFVLNLLFFFLVILFFEAIVKISGESNISIWFYFIPLSSFFIGFFEIVSSWNNRTEQYKNISYSKISRAFLTVSAQSSFKFIKPIGNGLVLGTVIGQAFSAIVIFWLSFKSIAENIKFFSLKRSFVLIRKYKDIPLYNTLLGALNTLSNQIPFILLGKYFGIEVVAFYGMASKIILTPIGLIGESIAQVFYKTATDIVNEKKDLYRFVIKTYKNLFKLISLPLIFIFAATFLFGYILGDGWEKTGLFSRLLLPWFIIGFINRPVSGIITILKKQKITFWFDIILLISRFLSIYLAYKMMFDDVTAVALFSGVGVLYGIFIFFFLIYISKNTKRTY